ncbi:MAG: DUF4174 domain-containing protein [Bacteroidota bacterium]
MLKLLTLLIVLQINPVAELQWEKRVLIVSAESSASLDDQTQQQRLSDAKKEMMDRDLVVYRLYNDHWFGPSDEPLEKGQTDVIREAYAVPTDQFMVVLIGKDGSVKLRSDEPVSVNDLFNLIDRMPMRRAEMRKKGQE